MELNEMVLLLKEYSKYSKILAWDEYEKTIIKEEILRLQELLA